VRTIQNKKTFLFLYCRTKIPSTKSKVTTISEKIQIIALDLSINALDLLINVIDLTIIAADLTFQTASQPFIRHLTTFLQVPHKHSCFRRDRFGLLTAERFWFVVGATYIYSGSNNKRESAPLILKEARKTPVILKIHSFFE